MLIKTILLPGQQRQKLLLTSSTVGISLMILGLTCMFGIMPSSLLDKLWLALDINGYPFNHLFHIGATVLLLPLILQEFLDTARVFLTKPRITDTRPLPLKCLLLSVYALYLWSFTNIIYSVEAMTLSNI